MARKRMLLIGGSIVLQAAAAWALTTFVIGPQVRGEPLPWQKHAQTEEAEQAQGARRLGPLLAIDELLVNVAGTKGRRFCRTSLTLEMNDEKFAHEAEAWMPVFRGRVIDLLSTKDMDQLTAPGARDTLRVEILETLNAEATGGEFTDLFFTEFLVQ